jgi:hypothetical protein
MSKSKNNPSLVEVEMKPLTEKEYSQAPEAVRKVYISALQNIPMDLEEKRQTILAHPDYFILKTGKKSFGEKFKRLSNLKQHRDSLIKKAARKQARANARTIVGEITPDEVISVAFVPKNQVQFPPVSECVGDCGMNYCDDNGCIDRKREPVEIAGTTEDIQSLPTES